MDLKKATHFSRIYILLKNRNELLSDLKNWVDRSNTQLVEKYENLEKAYEDFLDYEVEQLFKLKEINLQEIFG